VAIASEAQGDSASDKLDFPFIFFPPRPMNLETAVDRLFPAGTAYEH
jgi:hypothetical protein